jgi:riboflavin kinase / FMN adenylyltransferase
MNAFNSKNRKSDISKPTAIAVGVFDGVHRGHKKIIESLIRHARLNKLCSLVVTFNPHPGKVLKGESAVSMLSSLGHRISLIKSLGVDACIVVDFNKKLMNMQSKYFFKSILMQKLGMKELFLGEKFSFGKEGLSSRQDLKKIADNLGFKLHIIKPVLYRGNVISSSIIRKLIEKGRLDKASRLLGRRVSILGRVVHGRKRGRILGFKTANIDPHHEAIPPSGVYAAYAVLGKKIYKAVLNIGRRPTFRERDPNIEVHIFGINKNLYNKNIEAYFVKKLRPEKRFQDIHSLRVQIHKDTFNAKKLLSSSGIINKINLAAFCMCNYFALQTIRYLL